METPGRSVDGWECWTFIRGSPTESTTITLFACPARAYNIDTSAPNNIPCRPPTIYICKPRCTDPRVVITILACYQESIFQLGSSQARKCAPAQRRLREGCFCAPKPRDSEISLQEPRVLRRQCSALGPRGKDSSLANTARRVAARHNTAGTKQLLARGSASSA